MGRSFNPIFVILKENKLTGPNYIDWKRNLNLVLAAEKYKFVLTDVCPPAPYSKSSKDEVEAIRRGERQMKWLGAIYWPSCPMYCSTNTSTWPLPMTWCWTSKRCLGLESCWKIGSHDDTPQHEDGRRDSSPGSCSEDDRSSEWTRDSRSRDDGESQVDIVLMSLSKSFKNFCLNYSN